MTANGWPAPEQPAGLAADQASQPWSLPPPGYFPGPPPTPPPPPPTNQLAVASLIAGVTQPIFWLLPAIPAVMLGHMTITVLPLMKIVINIQVAKLAARDERVSFTHEIGAHLQSVGCLCRPWLHKII